MIFIFTTSNAIGSKLIEWGLGTKYSHFAIAESNISDAFVIDSTIEDNVSLQKFYEFQKKYKVVCYFEIPSIDRKESQRIFNKLYSTIKNKKYDYKGVTWLGLAVLWYYKILRKPLPRENKWADKNSFYCSEILSVIEDDLFIHGVNLTKYSNQMITPDIAFKAFLSGANISYIEKV